MSASRVSLRFWAAMTAAPAAFASAASCGGPSSDARHPEPETDLVVGTSDAAPIETVDSPDAGATDPKTAQTRRRVCGIDQYPAAQCISLSATDCPEIPPPTRALRSPFGGRTKAQLDRERTAAAQRGSCCYDWCEPIAVAAAPSTQCAPAQVRRTECFPAPEKGTKAPAPPPHDRCPSGVVFSEVASATGAFEGSFEAASTEARMRAPDAGAMVGSSRVDLQACKLEYSIVSPK